MLRILGAFTAVCGLFLLVAKSCKPDAEAPVDYDSVDVFDSMSNNDTLLITATFSECGEWGGHRERIQVYRVSKIDTPNSITWAAAWLLDTIGCSRPMRRFFVAGRRSKLTPNDEVAVALYSTKLKRYGKQKQAASHGGNVFRVIWPWFVGKPQIRVLDSQKQWKGFDELRDQLFKQPQRP